MALGITGIPDCKAFLGASQWLRGYQLAGDSSYPTGGYVITNQNVELDFIFGAWVIAVDHEVGIYYTANFVLPAGAFGTTPKPQKSINLLLTQPQFSGQGQSNEIPGGTSLTGAYWDVYFVGY